MSLPFLALVLSGSIPSFVCPQSPASRCPGWGWPWAHTASLCQIHALHLGITAALRLEGMGSVFILWCSLMLTIRIHSLFSMGRLTALAMMCGWALTFISIQKVTGRVAGRLCLEDLPLPASWAPGKGWRPLPTPGSTLLHGMMHLFLTFLTKGGDTFSLFFYLHFPI